MLPDDVFSQLVSHASDLHSAVCALTSLAKYGFFSSSVS